jgi:Mor family transcriptional regulator
VAADGTEGHPSRDDRVVAEFGDGLDVEGIAFRHGLTIEQVYAVIEREAGPAAPPAAYAGQGQGFQPSQGSPDDDAIVAEYSEGNEVEWIARKHGIDVERVYEVVQRIVDDDPRPPTGPAPSW